MRELEDRWPLAITRRRLPVKSVLSPAPPIMCRLLRGVATRNTFGRSTRWVALSSSLPTPRPYPWADFGVFFPLATEGPNFVHLSFDILQGGNSGISTSIWFKARKAQFNLHEIQFLLLRKICGLSAGSDSVKWREFLQNYDINAILFRI